MSDGCYAAFHCGGNGAGIPEGDHMEAAHGH